MSPFRLEMDLTDLQRLGARLTNFNPTPIYKAIGEHLRTKTEMSFRKEESPSGEPWDKSKRARETGGKTLVDKATLKNSITYLISGGELLFGPAPLPYDAIHQFGGKAGRGRKVEIPRRQYIPEGHKDFSEHDIRVMTEIVRRGLITQLGQA